MSTSKERFTAAWHSDAPRVLAYARRHVGLHDAPDIVAETFAVAWRRWDVVPDPPTPWLIGTARKVISNHHRSHTRRTALSRRVRLLTDIAAEPSDPWLRDEALYQLAALGEEHREALLLTGWDGLTSDDAACALGISPAAFRKRLQRARQRLDTIAGTNPTLTLTKDIS
jgi:RNA polymerase sigma-70 factor (ECF subfamily)